MATPVVNFIEFDEGKLRFGRPGQTVDKDGYPIISRGFIRGNHISPNDLDHVFTFKFKIQITSTNGKRTWLGRIVSPIYLNGGFDKWEIVVVCTKNDPDPGQETDSINITVTNPDGTSDPKQASVPASEIP